MVRSFDPGGNLVCGETTNQDRLPSRSFADRNRDRTFRHAERICENLDQFRVCSAVDGRRIETDEQGILADASQTGTSRSRHHTDGDQDALIRWSKHTSEFLIIPSAGAGARGQL